MDKEKQNKPNEFSPLMAFITVLLTLVCWMNIGPLLSLTLTMIPALGDDRWIGLTEFLFRHIPYIMMFLSLALGSRYLLKTRISELVAGNARRPDYIVSLYTFILYILILEIFSLLSFRTIHIDPSPVKEKLLYIIPVLLLTPMQAAAEELFFRALPARLIYHNSLPKSIKEAIPLSIVSGLLFLIPHLGNPEVLKNRSGIIAIIYYFLWGAAAMALAIYTDGFEMPIAMHAANNIYCALIVNYRESAMPTKAIFIDEAPSSSAILLFKAIVIYAVCFAFAYMLRRHGYFRRRDNGKKEND